MKALRKGLVLPDYKYGSLSTTKIQMLPPPRFVEILLKDGKGRSEGNDILVQEGDEVLVGTKLTDPADPNLVPLHSSASGRVSKITEHSILIESDEADKFEAAPPMLHDLPSRDRLIELIRQAGLVDLGGSAFPTHLRLKEAREKKVHTLVINGCESEPFLTADHVLMLNHPVEVLKGTELLRTISGARRAVLVTERNKLDVIEILNTKNYNLKLSAIETASLPVRFPQGSERFLAEAVLGTMLEPRQSAIQAGVLVENVATAFAAYEAIYLNKPLFERVVTLAGPCMIEPKNVWARIGTKAGDLIRSAKGFLRPPSRVIFGGPMTGEAVGDLDRPMTKRVQGILALPGDLIPAAGAEQPCIRCAKCVDVCSESLFPETLMKAVKKGNHALALEHDIDSCSECGLCSYICPSHIPLVSIIQLGKTRRSHHYLPAHAACSQSQS